MTSAPSDLDRALSSLRLLILSAERFRSVMASRFDLSISETSVLSQLAAAGGDLTPTALGQRMRMSSGSMTAVIDRLIADGYVAREPNPSDRRSSLIVLKPPGRRALRFAARRLEWALTASTGPEDLGAVGDLLARLARAIDEQTAPFAKD